MGDVSSTTRAGPKMRQEAMLRAHVGAKLAGSALYDGS